MDFISTIRSSVYEEVFTLTAEHDELDQQQRAELLHKKRTLLSQYCRTFHHGVFPIRDATFVFQYYSKYYTEFGDIIKLLLYKCRDLNVDECALAVSRTLMSLYDEVTAKGSEFPLSDAFCQLRDLAKKFAAAFSSDHSLNRDVVNLIIRRGIDYVFVNYDDNESRQGTLTPIGMHYLDVIIEFNENLIREDKVQVMRYLDQYGPPTLPPSKDSAWKSYRLYRNSLAS
ncbi:hypothetical protein KIN20_000168 [Parelaphostrongylus tenuis]|uniref:Uncharacterized protein n=1 Tax=Parelaphostrongylus tenuis TaxID=148309 RepID=A0AAD5QBN4_PARTN|nr:hypothetical protein KIN20_000168 [Parelaphostrongylus tenuis]